MNGYKKFGDGREVCSSSRSGRAEYNRRRELVWDRDRGLCCLCGAFVPLEQATVEHLDGRGHGGGKRDDRIEALGVAHWFGNNAKGSITYKRYMEKPLEERILLCQGIATPKPLTWMESLMEKVNTKP